MRQSIPNPVTRSLRRFSENPASIGNAVRLIIGVTVLVILAGSAAIWVLDRRDFPDYGTALWFSLQTVTTVGYGDVTPSSVVGKVVAAMVMVTAISFTAVITAAITSTFVEAGQRRRATADRAAARHESDLEESKLDEIARRLATIEELLAKAG